MKRPALLLATGLSILASTGCTPSRTFPAPPPVTAAATAPMASGPYLSADRLTALAATVPAPPAPGSAADQADRAGSQALVHLVDTDRWTLAQRDAELNPAMATSTFDCVLGTRLAETPPPALVHLLTRTLADAGRSSELAKARQFRARPFVDDPNRAICIRRDDRLARSSSYPSGHAEIGALWGDVFAALAPDKAAQIQSRARAFGQSRLVCGVHYPSDVAAGEALGHAVFRELQAEPAFRADLAAARNELAAERRRGLTNPGCPAERAALAQLSPP